MTEPELMFCEDGTLLSWHIEDGYVFCAVSDETESHEHRFVLGPEDIAPMLLRALDTRELHYASTLDLRRFLRAFVHRLDAMAARR